MIHPKFLAVIRVIAQPRVLFARRGRAKTEQKSYCPGVQASPGSPISNPLLHEVFAKTKAALAS
jgi:hypothetical protein